MNYQHDPYGRYNQGGQPEQPAYYPPHYPQNEQPGYPPQHMEQPGYLSQYDPRQPDYPPQYGHPQPTYPLEEQPLPYPPVNPQPIPRSRPEYPPQYGHPQQPYYDYQPSRIPGLPDDLPQGDYGWLPPPSPAEKQVEKKEETPPTVSKGLLNVYGWLEAIVMAWIIMVVFCTFFLRTVGVDGPSMNPTLEDQDKLVVTSMFYQPSRGDIIVIKPTEKMEKALIKRVIGLPGDQIEISENTNGEVYINGAPLQPEDYIHEVIHLGAGEEYILEVPPGCVFVLGDNRNNSIDSRSQQVDMVDIRYIMGKAIFRVSPHMRFFAQPNYNGG